jgi:hypothetical protein
MGQHVRKEVDAADARSGDRVIVVRAEVERQRASLPDTLLERPHQRGTDSPAPDVGAYHQGMELPGVAVFRDGANPTKDLVVCASNEADAAGPECFRDLLPRHLQGGQPVREGLDQECRNLIDCVPVIGSQIADPESWLLLVRTSRSAQGVSSPLG